MWYLIEVLRDGDLQKETLNRVLASTPARTYGTPEMAPRHTHWIGSGPVVSWWIPPIPGADRFVNLKHQGQRLELLHFSLWMVWLLRGSRMEGASTCVLDGTSPSVGLS